MTPPAEYLSLANRLGDAARAIVRASADGFTLHYKMDGSPVDGCRSKTPKPPCATSSMRKCPCTEFSARKHESFGLDREFVWVLDPIDGTRQFTAGVLNFGVLIALCHEGTPVLGIIEQPLAGLRWVGVAGVPTTLNGRVVTARDCGGIGEALANLCDPDCITDETSPGYEAIRGATRWNIYDGGLHRLRGAGIGQTRSRPLWLECGPVRHLRPGAGCGGRRRPYFDMARRAGHARHSRSHRRVRQRRGARACAGNSCGQRSEAVRSATKAARLSNRAMGAASGRHCLCRRRGGHGGGRSRPRRDRPHWRAPRHETGSGPHAADGRGRCPWPPVPRTARRTWRCPVYRSPTISAVTAVSIRLSSCSWVAAKGGRCPHSTGRRDGTPGPSVCAGFRRCRRRAARSPPMRRRRRRRFCQAFCQCVAPRR